MKGFLLLLILGTWLFYRAGAQDYFNKREALHGGGMRIHSVIEANGKYYTSGCGIDSINHVGNGVFLGVLSIRFTVWDKVGNIVRDTFYQRADNGGAIAESNSLVELPDHTFLVAGWGGDTSGQLKLFLSCWDSSGNFIWTKEYNKPFCNGLTNDGYMAVKDFKPDGYGNWLMLSSVLCRPPAAKPYYRMLLTKLDSSFNVIWHKPYGDEIYNSFGDRLIVEPWGYTLAGGMNNENRTTVGYIFQAEIVKTDTAGNLAWRWRSSPNRMTNWIKDIIRTKDGGYVYCGQGGGYQILSQSGTFSTLYWFPWIEKIDSTGKSQWSIKVNHRPDGLDFGEMTNLKELPNGDIISSGQIISGFEPDDTADATFGVLLRLRADGTIKWKRKYTHEGETMLYHIYATQQTSDGGFIMGGMAHDDYYPYSEPKQRAWLFKVDSNGCASSNDPQCMPVSVSKGPESNNDLFTVYPNPANGQLFIALRNNVLTGDILITLRNTMGQAILDKKYNFNTFSYQQQIDISNVESGVYFVDLKAEGVHIIKRILIWRKG